ncbi:MAG TPA: response regulator [Nitrososphaera sp.]|nr:response regulator [Nitrososphaera sp.]
MGFRLIAKYSIFLLPGRPVGPLYHQVLRSGDSLLSRKILVVEDSLDMREVLHLHLKLEEFIVFAASNGIEGLYLAEAEKPDLIITDINMPEMDGISLIIELRAQAEFKNTPIIALTAYGKEELDNAIRAGANRAIRKPVPLDSLIDDIKELLD